MNTLSGAAESQTEYRRVFDAAVEAVFRQTLRIIHASPGLLLTGTNIALNQNKAADIWHEFERKGLFVPPVMIISITSRCNLASSGCYMKQQRAHHTPEMSPDLLRSVVDEAADLEVSVIVIAGGEPLIRKAEIFSLARSFPRILFPLFTNGIMIDNDTAKEIAANKNIVPLISFEGFRPDTDSRRGSGVYDRLLSSCAFFNEGAESLVLFLCSLVLRGYPAVEHKFNGYPKRMRNSRSSIIFFRYLFSGTQAFLSQGFLLSG